MRSNEGQEISENNFEKWLNTNYFNDSSIAFICEVSEDIAKKWTSQKDTSTRFLESLTPSSLSYKSSVQFLNENQDHELDFEISVEDYFTLSRKALELGCSIGELIARELNILSQEP